MKNAYGHLKSEHGVHRLVRVSPFDANARRQTSFAALEVMPEIPDDVEVDIRPEDVEMQVFRSSGAGGQHINKTSSAVRLIHKPTGIVVSVKTERSQFQTGTPVCGCCAPSWWSSNAAPCGNISDIKGVQLEISSGAARSVLTCLCPTQLKDNRTGYETSNINAVMDGELDGFINAYLKAEATGNWAEINYFLQNLLSSGLIRFRVLFAHFFLRHLVFLFPVFLLPLGCPKKRLS